MISFRSSGYSVLPRDEERLAALKRRRAEQTGDGPSEDPTRRH